MDELRFRRYLNDFEVKVIIQGVNSKLLGKSEMVAVRSGKLQKTPYGRLIGSCLNTDLVMAVDYYGLTKKSSGFSLVLDEVDGQVRVLEAIVVHFASIRIECVAELAPEMVGEFPAFKKKILRKRGFK